jgi:DNA-binding NarL/FixJ family response regulator
MTAGTSRVLDGDSFPPTDGTVPSSLPLTNDFELSGQRLLLVTEEELQRLVLDVHDGPVQSLFASLSHIAVVQSRLSTVTAIRQVAAGQLVFPQSARRWLSPPRSAPDALTEREEKVLALVAEGASNAHIATSLRVSESTVKFHLRNMFSKLGAANRTEAAAHYLRRR